MAAPHAVDRSFRVAVLALMVALAGAAAMLYYHLGLFVPQVLETRAARGLGNGYSFGDDFYPIWLTSLEWQSEHRDPYSREMTRAIQTGLFGRPLDPRNPGDRYPGDPSTDYREFAYPAFADLLLWPSAAVGFPALRIVLVVVLPVLTVASVMLWMSALLWRPGLLWVAVIVALTLCNYPVLEALFAEQPGLMVAFFLAAAALALRRGRLLLGGILMSMTLIKPQMTLLATLYLLVWSLADRRRARFWQGWMATTLLLVGASLWIWPRWIGQWLRILLGYHRYAAPPLVAMLPGPTLGAYIGPVAIAAFLGVSAWLAWRNRQAYTDSPDFWITLSLQLAITSIAVLPGQAIYDHVILLPGIFLLLRDWRKLRDAGPVSRTLLAVGALILFWPWVAALALLAVRPWLAPETFNSQAVFALPIRTAASLPFAVLALLAYARRVSRVVSQEPA